MNSEEQTLIDGLFSRLQQAEKDAAPRDVQAEARIKEHMTRQPAAGYFMTQAILVQETALKSLDEQNRQLTQQIEQLQADLQQARQQPPAPSGGGFLSSIVGGSSRDPRPTSAPGASPASGGGFDPARDIEAITIHRWAHGYAREYMQPWDRFWPLCLRRWWWRSRHSRMRDRRSFLRGRLVQQASRAD